MPTGIRNLEPLGAARIALCAVLLLVAMPAAADDDGEQQFSGSVELVYRNVETDGSERKYDEDFDGLDSGLRLGSLDLDWSEIQSGMIDYARLQLSGLGGDPYERSSLRLGRKDVYDLRATHWKQDYIYNLFELVNNEDGATWDAQRQITDLSLRAYPGERVKLVFQYQDGRRSGTSLFMKDLERNLFRFETPLDMENQTFTIGADFEIGPVNVVFRQSRRSYDNRFENFTEDDLGLETSLSSLRDYAWLQRDKGDTDLTTLKVAADLGERVDLTVSLIGTFIGDEELKSDVRLDASGTSFRGTCSVTGAACTRDAQCAGVAGNVCVPNPLAIVDGFSRSDLDGEMLLVDSDLTVRLADPVDLHVQYRRLDRELEGSLSRDLDADGVEDDIDEDGVPGTRTRLDYSLDTLTAFVEGRPSRKVAIRGGYRIIDRKLDRNGFTTLRDTDFESDDDEVLIFGLSLRPVKWFRLNADYEDGDITQPFNAVAPRETEHRRVRASFRPQTGMRVELGYLDFDYRNTGPDLRVPGSFYDGASEGTTHSVSFWHEANPKVSYLFRYAEQEIETRVGVTFDQAGFGVAEDGDSIFDVDSQQLSGQVNYRWREAWSCYARFTTTESDGDNLLVGDTLGLVNDESIRQDYDDWEVGVTYSFPSGVFFGASYRDFEYDDGGRRVDGAGVVTFRNDGLDYGGQIVSVRAGFSF